MAGRIAILADYPEERWPSMDLVAEMLTRELQADPSLDLDAERICPPYKRRATMLSRSRRAQNADRLLNRMRDYPRFAAGLRDQFDFFHVCDHSYSQIVHALPADRTGVFCHDLDTFRCLLEPRREPRPRWFTAMTRRILAGLQKAAVVFHATLEIRAQIERFALVDPARLVHAPLGVAPEFLADAPSASEEGTYVLHVGSCIERKRIDVLLDVFAAIARKDSQIRLMQVGGMWTESQRQRIDRLLLADRIVQRRELTREQIAALYRGAKIVLLPSEAEGFGLPLLEALACGAPVLASDIPVLREIGGDVVEYRPVGDIDAWVRAAESILNGESAGTRDRRKRHACSYTWRVHAETIARAYRRLGGC